MLQKKFTQPNTILLVPRILIRERFSYLCDSYQCIGIFFHICPQSPGFCGFQALFLKIQTKNTSSMFQHKSHHEGFYFITRDSSFPFLKHCLVIQAFALSYWKIHRPYMGSYLDRSSTMCWIKCVVEF